MVKYALKIFGKNLQLMLDISGLFRAKKGSLKKYDNGVELLLYSFRMMFEGV